MLLDINKVKISTTVPAENLDAVRSAMSEAGAGIIGNYTECSYSCKVIGTFRPGDGANPYIGTNGQLEFVEEEKLEMICDVEKVKEVVSALRRAYPYEEPAIEIIPLLEEDFSRLLK